MATILERIIETKRGEVAKARARVPMAELETSISALQPTRDFFAAVVEGKDHAKSVTGDRIIRRHPQLIAEIKKASPSAGLIRPNFDPVAIALSYFRAGASALSVLTDETYFHGRLEYIRAVKDAVPLPVLRKDFIIDEYQIVESRIAGADAILLIAEAIGVKTVAAWLPTCLRLGLGVLVEVHEEASLAELFNEVGPPYRDHYLLGINNRDLATQKTDLDTTSRLARLIPSGTPFVSESGIRTKDDVRSVRNAGAVAILVGESLLRAHDVSSGICELYE